MKRSLRARGSIFLLIVLAVIIFDLGFFAASLLPAPRNPETIETVDLIAVLTGGRRRLKEAVTFLSQGRGKYLFISGVARGSDVDQIFRANKVDPPPEIIKSRIYLGEEAGSTHENAVEVRGVVERLQIQSVMLVTSTYHVQRALRLLQNEFSGNPALKDVRIYTYPVESPNFDRRHWVQSPTAWSILIWEYLKYLPVRFGFKF